MSQATQTALAAPHEELVAPLLRLEGLSRHYRMGESIVRALDGIDLGIRVGEFLTIVVASVQGFDAEHDHAIGVLAAHIGLEGGAL